MKLQKSVISGNDMDTTDGTTNSVYSLALVDTESVHTAHEKDMAQFRDALKEEDSPQATATTMALEPTLHQQTIANPNFGNTRMTAYASQQERLSGRVVAGAAAAMPALTSRMSSKPARKATTAANFFGTKTKDSNKSAAAAKKPPAAAAKKPAAATKKSKAATRESVEPMDVDNDEGTTNNSSSRGEEKENSINKTKSAVGNVDDFVGDVDSEDEEFQQSEKERKRRNEAREKKQRKKKEQQPVQQDDEEEEESPVKVHGAMDAFAQHVEKKPEQEPRKTKRRKRLVEKTTVDANGYMHTETQAVWEDVEEEEEPAVASKPDPVKKKAPAKNTKNMKQGSLMGFFKKK